MFQAPRAAASARTRGGGRGEGIKGAGFPLSRPPFLHQQPPTRLKGRTAWPLLWPVLFVRQSGNTFSNPLFLAPPPLCLQAPRPVCACVPNTARRPAHSGPPPAAGGPRRSLLLGPQCAPPTPALPACLAPRGRRCHLLAGVVLLWPSCAERGRSCSHRPSRGPRPPRGYRDIGCCCPRLHPLLIMFTVPPATLPDFSNSSEASNHLSTPGLKDILTFCKAQQSSVLNFLSSVSKFYEITPILPFPPFSELIPISCQGKRPRKVDDLDYFTPTI